MIRKELTNKQQKYETKYNLDKNCAIDFHNQEFPLLSGKQHEGMGHKLL